MITINRTPLLALGLLGVALAAMTYGCSDSTTPGATADAGKATTDGGGTTNNDGGGTDTDGGGTDTDGGGDTDGGTTGGAKKTGTVSLTQTTIVAGAMTLYSTAVSAYFFPVDLSATPSYCTKDTIGACSVLSCDLSKIPVVDAGPPVDAGPVVSANAGAITLSGPKLTPPVVLTPDDKGAYKFTSGMTQVFAGDDDLEAKAAGATVPAFDIAMLKAPKDITVTAPMIPATGYVLDKTMDLKFTWTGGGTGNVHVKLSTADAVNQVTITCLPKAADGTVTVTKEALAKLQTTSATINGQISAQPENSATTMAGDYTVTYDVAGTSVSGVLKNQ